MPRKKFVRKKSKYEDQAVIVDSVITAIELKNAECGNNLKNVFRCPSYLCPEGRVCIAYGKYNFEVGDEVVMKGRCNGDVFLVWSMYIKPKKTEEQEVEAKNESKK